MDNLQDYHLRVIVDLNSAAAYIKDSKEAFANSDIAECLDLMARALREIASAQENIKPFLRMK